MVQPREGVTLCTGDALAVLRSLPAESVHCCVTSPPYWGLRDYGTAKWEGGDAGCDHKTGRDKPVASTVTGGIPHMGSEGIQRDACAKCGARRVDSQLGLEPTPGLYVQHMVEVFREVRRVLRPEGTLWLVLGDSYNGAGPRTGTNGKGNERGQGKKHTTSVSTLKPKDLVGIPWMVAFALRADGWWLRSDVIWAKPNPMPESVTDRPTRSHEYVFLLTKSVHYFYDAEAVKEPQKPCTTERYKYGWNGVDDDGSNGSRTGSAYKKMKQGMTMGEAMGGNGKRNRRSVWFIATQPYSGAHFACYPEKLVEPCIKAGTSERGCCPKCGAPWARVVKREKDSEMGRATGKSGQVFGKTRGSSSSTLALQWQGWTEHGPRHITLGWSPTCECYGALREQFGYTDEELTPELFRLLGYHLSEGLPPVPCTVLDPFAGSGTTGQVAVELGRRAVLIDLNPEYRPMQVERVAAARAPLPGIEEAR
jgi:DNA modification methylase